MVTFAILMPFSGRYVPPLWAINLMSLQWPLGCSHFVLSATSKNRAQNRTDLVRSAIKHGVKYVLFMDDDTMPPPDAVKKLHYELETADDDVIACGGIYTTKELPSEPLVYLEEDAGPHWKWRVGDVFQCQGIGTGCLMIKADSFAKIPEPWFRDIDSIDEVGDDPAMKLPPHLTAFRMTDDLYFCMKVKQAGLKILAHGGVLCVHWDQNGNPYTLPRDSYPMKDIAQKPWYAGFGVIKENVVGTGTNSVHLESARIGDVELPEGWLTQGEADTLHNLARGRNVLELGAFRGRSTVCMAMSAKSVTSVDWHQGDNDVEIGRFGSSLDAYRKAIAPYPNVTPVIGRFEDEVPKLEGREFDLVFVDGAHDRASVIRDMGYALSFKPAIVAVHDWNLDDVAEAVRSMGIEPSSVVNTLAIFERQDAPAATA
jgi:hypothetical protein